MRMTARLIALVAIGAGLVGMLSPDRLVMIGQYVVTPLGLYVIAAVRVAVGIVLILAAPVSRVPRTLRAIGAVVFVAGLATPLFGVERTRAILDWESTQPTVLIRLVAGFVVVAAGFVAFAVTKPRS